MYNCQYTHKCLIDDIEIYATPKIIINVVRPSIGYPTIVVHIMAKPRIRLKEKIEAYPVLY